MSPVGKKERQELSRRNHLRKTDQFHLQRQLGQDKLQAPLEHLSRLLHLPHLLKLQLSPLKRYLLVLISSSKSRSNKSSTTSRQLPVVGLSTTKEVNAKKMIMPPLHLPLSLRAAIIDNLAMKLTKKPLVRNSGSREDLRELAALITSKRLRMRAFRPHIDQGETTTHATIRRMVMLKELILKIKKGAEITALKKTLTIKSKRLKKPNLSLLMRKRTL